MSSCPRCQQEFACGCDTSSHCACWCLNKPVLKISTQAELPRAARACYCPQCLDDLLRQQQDPTASKAAPA